MLFTYDHHIVVSSHWSFISLLTQKIVARFRKIFVINLQKMFHGHFDRLLIIMNDKGGVNFTQKIFKTHKFLLPR